MCLIEECSLQHCSASKVKKRQNLHFKWGQRMGQKGANIGADSGANIGVDSGAESGQSIVVCILLNQSKANCKNKPIIMP